MEFLLENILNLVGFLVGLAIGIMSVIGFRNTGSPTLFRLTVAFFSISIGFFVIWAGYMVEDFVIKSGNIERWIQTLGIVIQTVGYFFIAFSHSIISFFPKSRYFRSVGIFPLFLVSSVQIAHIFRSVSFILLAYGAIETILSYFENKNKGAISVAVLLSFLKQTRGDCQHHTDMFQVEIWCTTVLATAGVVVTWLVGTREEHVQDVVCLGSHPEVRYINRAECTLHFIKEENQPLDTAQPLTVVAGRHRIELRANGCQPVVFDLDVLPGQVVPYQGPLVPLRPY